MHEIIERQVSHMARLLDDLLDISRVTRGNISLNKQTVQLADVIARAVESATPLIEARHHTLSLTVCPTNPRLLGDFDRLIQIVNNLLTNAAKYTPEGGQIWMHGGSVEAHSAGLGQGSEFIVRLPALPVAA